MGRSSSDIILASASPRRQELMRRLGFEFAVEVAAVDEQAYRGGSPEEATARVAAAKGVALRRPGRVVVAADTAVVTDGEVLGKPGSSAEATDMLRRLRGQRHRVLTAIAVVAAGRTAVDVVSTLVQMRPYGEEEIAAYVASGEPFDKAGAYAIQDRRFRPVERIRGCYQNVIGLPLCHLCRRLQAAGVTLPGVPPPLCRVDLGRECPVAMYNPTEPVWIP